MDENESVHEALRAYVHLRDGGRADVLPVTPSFWDDVAAGRYPQLEGGRLVAAFAFDAPWPVWERHPAGEEIVLLLAAHADLVLEDGAGERTVHLHAPGEYVLVPAGTWHTARTTVPTTMLFVTPGAGTEHRPVQTPP